MPSLVSDTFCMSMALKLIAGRGRCELNNFVPKLTEPLRLCKKRTRHTLEGTQIARKTKASSLDVYKRSFEGALPSIWSRIPVEIITRGERKGWLKIKTACVNFLIGKSKSEKHKKRKTVETPPEIYTTKLNNELNGNV